MKALVIDDSRLARKELIHLIEGIDDLELAGEAAGADEAIEQIKTLKPDLIFLDIQMPGKTGFELLEELDAAPIVIFTTAYDEYALKAFEYNALDYLQKPIVESRFQDAVNKAKERISSIAEETEKQQNQPSYLNPDSQVFVKDGDNCWFVNISDIQLFEIEGSYTRIHFENEKPMIPKTLNYLETRLDPTFYFRVNRQQIINLKWIDRVEPWFSGGIKLYLKGGSSVEVSRRQTAVFKELMSF